MLELPLSAQMFPSTEGQLCKLKYHLDIEADVPMAPDLEVHPKIGELIVVYLLLQWKC